MAKLPGDVGLPGDVRAGQSAEIARRRKRRNWAVLIVLVGLSALFYAMTVVKFLNR